MFHHMGTVHMKNLNKEGDSKHIQPLWLMMQVSAQVHKTDCEGDTGAGCIIMPIYIYQALSGDRRLDLQQSTSAVMVTHQ